ncbi:WhiB family transcriptional regulator [Mycolicibacterium sp. Y3]
MTQSLGRAAADQKVCIVETPDAPELWASDRQPTPAVRKHLEQMCLRCPARRSCAEDAVVQAAQTGMYAGVWVPPQSDRQKWLTAMDRLRQIAGIGDAVGDRLQVST